MLQSLLDHLPVWWETKEVEAVILVDSLLVDLQEEALIEVTTITIIITIDLEDGLEETIKIK